MQFDFHNSNTFQSSRFVLHLVFIALATFFLAPVPAHAQQDKEFVDLFHKEWAGFHVISEEAQAFVLACCEDRAAAVELLTHNGFSVESVTEPGRVRELNEHWNTDKPYDVFVHASRGAGWLRFWRAFTSYRVVLFVRADKVLRVYAVVDTTMP